MYIVIFVTAPNKKEATRIAEALVKSKLVACVNIIDKIQSLFWWEGKVDSAKESLLIIKTTKSKLPKVVKTVKSRHTYQVPEIIALPIIGGYKPYLKWINDSLR